jgi:hypothetical protein
MKLRLSILMLGLLVLFLGCAEKKDSPVARVAVSGSIKVDGKDVATGNITFDAQNGQPPGDISIRDGKYEGKAPVGKCKVMITSIVKMSLKEKMKMDGPGYDAMNEYNLLPERYNSKTELVREVAEPGPHLFDFIDLKSK